MTELLATVIPYTAALTGLVGASFNVAPLRPCPTEALRVRATLITAVAELISITAIVYAASRAPGGRAAAVGGATAFFAILLPRLVVDPAVAGLCGSCAGAGKFGIGFVALFVLAVVNYLVDVALH